MTMAKVPLGLVLVWVKGTLPSLKFEVSLESQYFFSNFFPGPLDWGHLKNGSLQHPGSKDNQDSVWSPLAQPR